PAPPRRSVCAPAAMSRHSPNVTLLELPISPSRAPKLPSRAGSRWVQAVKQECLDHFVVFGEGHLRHLLREYVAHSKEERPQQGRDNLPLGGTGPDPGGGKVVCRERLGGLLKHFTRRAA